MSLLHSFYCWGYVAVVLLSTAYFAAFGVENWRYLPLAWAVLPLANAFLYARVPMVPPVAEHERTPIRSMFGKKVFWLFLLMMICAGASEQAMGQWASLFAERGLNVSKTVGDLLGPLRVRGADGAGRAFCTANSASGSTSAGRWCSRGGRCACAAIWWRPTPRTPCWGLLGCALTGFSVALMWAGARSPSWRASSRRAARRCSRCWRWRAAMWATPWGRGWWGFVSGGAGLNAALMVACAFPVLMLAASLYIAF